MSRPDVSNPLAAELGTDRDAPDPGAGTPEAAVRTRWCEVLGVPQANGDDDFFQCGGHSLLAFRLTEALREDLGVPVPVSALFEARTLSGYQQVVADLVRRS